MKKITLFLTAIVLCAGLLTGCGDKYDTEESTIFILKDGTIVSTDVESFDTATYDEEGLRTYVEEKINTYNDEYGKNCVSLEKLTVEENIAKLIIKYASDEDYTRFNGVELFCGTMADALVSGYPFDVAFAAIQDGKATSCSASDVKGADGYKVVVLKANGNVQVKGDIAYVSVANVELLDDNKISVKAGNSLFGGSTEEPEGTDTQAPGGTETEGTENPDTETQSEEDAVEDEIIVTEEESENVEFDFPEEPEPTSGESVEPEPVYTYIVYK